MQSYIKTRTIQSLTSDMKKNKILLDTSIQRKSDQWDNKKKSLLIMSLIEGVIVPGIFAKELADKKIEILDGKQRLTTIYSYVNDEFKLDKSCAYPKMKFSELEEDIQNTIKNAEISMNVYQNISDEQTNDIFLRLNNGQVLSNDNKLRPLFNSELKRFIDEAINHNFITEKCNLTKGQLRKSEDEGIMLQILYLLESDSPLDLTNKSLTNFVINKQSSLHVSLFDIVIESMDKLDAAIPEKNTYLKKISIPFIVANAVYVLNNKNKDLMDSYIKEVIEFLNDYENRDDYLQFCKSATASSKNVEGRMNYFKELADKSLGTN